MYVRKYYTQCVPCYKQQNICNRRLPYNIITIHENHYIIVNSEYKICAFVLVLSPAF